ncbi:DHA2 family efflux MFS transporter permease subunit [Cohnella sp. CFH 77786]|uniref:DHA2 family efflux MFS transporter permease subunit n=1 Tax=Cohnella sp. CFH 77786 TaxID=2662265 RepID=UPI001C60FF76|nr:DHA2 family efflux MFS transporter permease subunit [Cohnella sp. CFH 77786]MBW5448567.1 DHA2 family efflux MFS transporter permease subunit [Cohnella sp. CFH 77786]
MSAQASSAGADQPFSMRAIIAPLLAVIIGMIMVILDSTVVNVALSKFQSEFNSTLSTIQWTFTGYTLALSAVIPLAGWMTDKFGSKRIFLITIALFTLGSALCATAQSIEQLIVYRVIQGVGGGMVAPIGMAMIFRLAPPDKRGAVMGMLGIPMLAAPALGPVLSGWLIEYASWQWIFLINVPIGVVAVLVGIKYLPKIEQNRAPALDVLGMILAPIAFSMLAYGVSEGGTSWTSDKTLTGLIVGGVALLLFIFVELRHKQPLLELRVFRSSDFTRGTLVVWTVQIALFGAMILMPVFLQSVKHYTALETGLIMLPQAIGSMLFMPIGGRLFDKIGARPLALVGLTVVAGALFMLSFMQMDTPLIQILIPLFMIGSGMGLSMMALNTHVLNAAPRHLVSRVTPLTTAAQQVVTSFAVAGLTGFLTSRTTDHMADAGQNGNPLEALVAAYGDTFLLSTGIALLGVALSIILRKPKAEPQEGWKPGAEKPDPSMMMGH